MNDQKVTITSSERDAIYRLAFSRMIKRAKDDNGDSSGDFPGNSSTGAAIGGLAGAVLGGGLGYLAHKTKPADKDENIRKRLWTHILGGAAMGGVAGAGLGYFNVPGRTAKIVKDMFEDFRPESHEESLSKAFKRVANDPFIRPTAFGVGGYKGSKRLGKWLEAVEERDPGFMSRWNRVGTKELFAGGGNFNPLASPASRSLRIADAARTPFGGKHLPATAELAIADKYPTLARVANAAKDYKSAIGKGGTVLNESILASVYDDLAALGIPGMPVRGATGNLTSVEKGILSGVMKEYGPTSIDAYRRLSDAAAGRSKGWVTRNIGTLPGKLSVGTIMAIIGALTADRGGKGRPLRDSDR